MNSDSRHVIMRQVVELILPKGQSPQPLQDKAVAIFRSQLLHHISHVLDACIPADAKLRIDCLDIDLGNLPITNWESEFVKRFETAFVKAVQEAVEHQLQKDEAEEWSDRTSIQHKSLRSGGRPSPQVQPSTWEALETFLTLGILPWWVKERGKDAIRLLVKDLLAYPPQNLTKQLVKIAENPEALNRLLYALEDTDVLALLNAITTHEGWIPAQIQGLTVLLQQADVRISKHQARLLIWENLLQESEGSFPAPSTVLQNTLQTWADSNDQTPIQLWQAISAHKRTHTTEQQIWLKATLEALPTQAPSSASNKAKAARLERALSDLQHWLAKVQQGEVETTTLGTLLKALAAAIEDKELKKEILQLAQQSASLTSGRKTPTAQLPSYEGLQNLAEALRAEAQQCPAQALLEAHTLLLELGQQHKPQTQSATIALSLRHLSEEFLRYLHATANNALPTWLPQLAQKLRTAIPFFAPSAKHSRPQRSRLLLAEHLATILATWDNAFSKSSRAQYTTLSQQIQRLSTKDLPSATEWKNLQALLSRIRPIDDILNHRPDLLQKLASIQSAETAENPIDHTALNTSLAAVANFEEVNASASNLAQQRAQWMAIAALLHQTATQALGQEAYHSLPLTDETWVPGLQQQTTELRQVLDLHFAQRFAPQLKALQHKFKALQGPQQTPQALEAFSLALSKLLHQVQMELKADQEKYPSSIPASSSQGQILPPSTLEKDQLGHDRGLNLVVETQELPSSLQSITSDTPPSPSPQPDPARTDQANTHQEYRQPLVLQKTLGLVAEMVLELITATEALLKKLNLTSERPSSTPSLNTIGQQWEAVLQLIDTIQDQAKSSLEPPQSAYSPSQTEDLAAIFFEIALHWVDFLEMETLEELSKQELAGKVESLEEKGVERNLFVTKVPADPEQAKNKAEIEGGESLIPPKYAETPHSQTLPFTPEKAKEEVEGVEITFENLAFTSRAFHQTEAENQEEDPVQILFEKPAPDSETTPPTDPQEQETGPVDASFEKSAFQYRETQTFSEDELTAAFKVQEPLTPSEITQHPRTSPLLKQQASTSIRNGQARQLLRALQQLQRQLSKSTPDHSHQSAPSDIPLPNPEALHPSEIINSAPTAEPESEESKEQTASEKVPNTSSTQSPLLHADPTSQLLQNFLYTLAPPKASLSLEKTASLSPLSEVNPAPAAINLDPEALLHPLTLPKDTHPPLLPFLKNWQQLSQRRPLPSPISTRLHKAITLIADLLSITATHPNPSTQQKATPSSKISPAEEANTQHHEESHTFAFQEQLSTFLQPPIILSPISLPDALQAPWSYTQHLSAPTRQQLLNETIQVLHTLLRQPLLRQSLNTNLLPHLKEHEATTTLPTGTLPQLEQISIRFKALLREPLPTRIHQTLRNLQQTISGTSNTAMDLRAVKRILQQANQVLAQTQKGKPQTRKQPEKDEAIYIDNAGLILLWPFLPRFFQNLGLLEGRQFISPEAHARAVLILQHLVDAEPETSEHLLPLCKLLCAYPSDRPINTNLQPTEEEREACEQLLGVVPHHHPAMKNMSPEGFRKAWLQREGVLRSRDDHYLLHVEKQAYDILLEQLPWSIRIIKLPWTQAAIMVEW